MAMRNGIIRIVKEPTPFEITHQADLLLFNEHPLIVRPSLASLVGLNEAIVIQQIHYWVVKNTDTDRNYRDGYYWTYNSVKGWAKQFPFWSYDTIKRTLNKLAGKSKTNEDYPKILITANYNDLRIDRTLWYRIDYDLLGILAKEPNKIPLVQNALMEKGNMHQPLPETNTETSKRGFLEDDTDDLFNSISKQDDLQQAVMDCDQSMLSKALKQAQVRQ